MPWSSQHLVWFTDLKTTVKTTEGKDVKLFKFTPDLSDKATMSAWAKHFRNHYCFDTEIDFLRMGTPHTRQSYLLELKFPNMEGFGPGIRAGDFAEILVSDYLEYLLDHDVPRTRYGTKIIQNESSKGSDLIGFKLIDDKETPLDILTMFEVKAQFSGQKANARLQEAVYGSAKDEARKGESLNAIKQRLMDKNELDKAIAVSRFQNPADKPYKEQYGAAAFFSTELLDETLIKETITSNHPKSDDLILIVISSDDCMSLVHKLYEIAAHEA